MKQRAAFSVIARICVSVLLVWAALAQHPSGFYTVLRWAVFIMGISVAYTALTTRQVIWCLLFGFIALLFNPLRPVWLDRATWVSIDLIVSILFVVSVFFVPRTPKMSPVARTDGFSRPTQPQIPISQSRGSSVKLNPSHSTDSSLSPANQGQSSRSHHERLQRIRKEYPRAYDRWTRDEEDQLASLLGLGMKPKQIAQRLKRQPSAIRSRIRRIDKQGLLVRNDASKDSDVATSPWRITETESAFLPLATSWMSESSVCVAGIDLHSQKWIRLVRKGSHSLGRQEASQYSYGQVYGVELDGFQKRPPKTDPRGLHVEDRILRTSPRLLGEYPTNQRVRLLQSICDKDLPSELLEKRSLFVVEPFWFTCTRREDNKMLFSFGIEGTDTETLRRSHALRELGIRVSRGGCPCNCLPWMSRVGIGKQRIMSMKDVARTAPTTRVFFVLSLTRWAHDLPKDKQGHYLILAGIHVLDEEKQWL